MLPRHFDRYEIEEEIARGAMGIVYRAHDPVIQRTVAIKVLDPQLLQVGPRGEEFLKRFFNEVRIAGTLNHPHVVIIFASAEYQGMPYIAMEYVPGGSLKDRMDSGEHFSPEQILDIMTQCCEALDHAHGMGIIHRDVKPANLLVASEPLYIKIADFGISKSRGQEDLTRPMDVVGTTSYMSPEQLQGVAVDGRSDLFSLGTVCYELVSGLRPFPGETIGDIVNRVLHAPVEFSSDVFQQPAFHAWKPVLEKVLAKDPGERFQTGREFCEALRRQALWNDDKVRESEAFTVAAPLETALPIPGETPPPPAETDRPSPRGRNRSLIWIVAGLLILLGTVPIITLLLTSREAIQDTMVQVIWAGRRGKTVLDGTTMPTLKAGEGITLALTPGATGYYYILYLDADLSGQFLFPLPEGGAPENPLEKGKVYYFPSENLAYKLGGTPGREEIHVIGAETPLAFLDAGRFPPGTLGGPQVNALLNTLNEPGTGTSGRFLRSIFYTMEK